MNNRKIIFKKSKNQGHRFEATLSNVKYKKTWCSKCSGKARVTKAECKKIAKKRGGAVWLLEEFKVPDDGKEHIPNNKIRLRWECDKVGHFFNTLYYFSKPQGTYLVRERTQCQEQKHLVSQMCMESTRS